MRKACSTRSRRRRRRRSNELYPEARAVGGEFGPAVTYDHLVLVYDTQDVNAAADEARRSLARRPEGLPVDLGAAEHPGPGADRHGREDGGRRLSHIDRQGGSRSCASLSPGVQTFEPNPDGYRCCSTASCKVATGWNARAQLYSDEIEGPHRRAAAAGGQRVPDQHHQRHGRLEEPRGGGRPSPTTRCRRPRRRRSPSGCSTRRPTPRRRSIRRRWRAPRPRRRTARA